MNRNPLARAVLAACITAVLLAPGLLLSHGALSAPASQAQQPDDYLPLIFGEGLPPEILTATAEAAPFATATAEAAATATAVAATLTAAATATTSTTTATTTGTATTTATATATATVTPSPTDGALTAQLQIANLTGFALPFTLVGPTNASGEVQPDQSWLVFIRPGRYKLTVYPQCSQPNTREFDVAADQSQQFSYTCP